MDSDRQVKGPVITENRSEELGVKEDGWYPGLCKMCMQGDCVIRVHVVDGLVVKVEGDPRAPNNRGTLCPKGNAAIMNMYSPYRVKTPVKRTNAKKGLKEDPGWVEITWDEAIQTVVGRLRKVRGDDPRKLVVVSGFGQVGAYFSGLLPFLEAFGSPNDVPARGSACAVHIGTLITQGQFPVAAVDSDRCEYVITFGRDMGPNHSVSSTGTLAFLNMIDRGCKVVSVEPRCSPMASKCYKWIPIRPGTDLAFLLGMLHTVLFEIGTIDMWFVKNRTNAPYLIGRDGDYLRDPGTKKPLIWDEAESCARPFDDVPPMQSALEGTFSVNGAECSPAFQLVKDAMKPYSPEWAQEVSTVSAETIRSIAQEFVSHARIGSTIEIDGYSFPFRPVAIQYQRGAYQHTIAGPFGDLVGKILLELVGALEVPGGVTGNWTPSPETIVPDEDGVLAPRGEAAGEPWRWPVEAVDARTFYPISHTRVSLMAKGILDPKGYHLSYEPEILFTCGGNPIRGGFDRELFEAAYSKVPFSFTVSLTFDEPAMMADIVFPEDSFLERDLLEPGPLFIMQPHKISEEATRSIQMFPWRDVSAIRKVYNTRNVVEILTALAEGVGILTGKGGFWDMVARSHGVMLDVEHAYTTREFAEVVLKQKYGAQFSLKGITDASGPMFNYRTKRGRENCNYFYWPDNKTRHPMYMVQLLRKGRELRENLAAAGLAGVPGWEEDMEFFWKGYQPIPTWIPCPEFKASSEYDMWAINWKTPGFPFYAGDTCGNAWLYEVINTFDPYEFAIMVNRETARRKALRDGELIVVESRHGKTQGRLRTTELVHPEVVGISGCHGIGSKMVNPIVGEGPYFNALCSVDEKNRAIDPVTGGIELGPAVKIYKAKGR